MVGLLKPTKGEIRLFGEKNTRFTQWHKIGYVPQKATNFDLQFPATVEEVVSMGRNARRGLMRSFNREDKKKVHEALKQVDMFDYKDKLIGDLSGGQQQRVFIARALASEPHIIFLDEPTAGIDVKTQEQFYTLLKKLNHDFGLTLVLVSHDIDVVAHEATELACINQTLIYHGSPTEFMAGDYLKNLYSKELKFVLHNH
jgi:zinc transport system ATP-binding protein